MKPAAGFTLVELMVAVHLGLIVIAGTLVAWMHVQRYYARAQIENRLHERAQYVFATLEPELQMAGYLGLGDTVPSTAAGTLPPIGTTLWRLAGRGPLPCARSFR